MFTKITRTVWIISLISLLNDFSSEMLYPVIPLYMKQIGYGSLLIGILEGLSECMAGFSKIYMGSLADQFSRRTPFISLGYALSVLSRPLMVMGSWAASVFGGRLLDKAGKGLRTGSRDALLAAECEEGDRATIFGFHRGMDTLGAILGPLLAIVWLSLHPGDLRSLFLLAVIPGCVAVLFTFYIREKKQAVVVKKKLSFREHFTFYQRAPKNYRTFFGIMMLFSLAGSSDMFLLLGARETGISESRLLWLYIIFNIVYAIFAYPLGRFADRYGKLHMLMTGILIYALTYLAFALINTPSVITVVFCAYGLFYAFTQSTTKAILLHGLPAHHHASAVGFFEGMNSLALMAANVLAGIIWYYGKAETMFVFTALMSVMVCLLLYFYRTQWLHTGKKILPEAEEPHAS